MAESMGYYVVKIAECLGVDSSGSGATVAGRIFRTCRDREYVLTLALRLCAQHAEDPEFVRSVVEDALDGTFAAVAEKELYALKRENVNLKKRVTILEKRAEDRDDGQAQKQLGECGMHIDEYVESVIALFEDMLSPGLDPVRPDNHTVRRQIKRLIKSYPAYGEIDAWKNLFRMAQASQFLCGKRGDFKVTLGWMIKEKNLNKILDRVYEDRQVVSLSPDECEQVIVAYNKTMCPPLMPVRDDNKSIRTKIIAASRGNSVRSTVGWWVDKFFQRVKSSSFLLGRNRLGWKADLYWLLKEENIDKLIDRLYDDKRARGGASNDLLRTAKYFVDNDPEEIRMWCDESGIDYDEIMKCIEELKKDE